MADTEDDLDAAERALGTLPRDGEGGLEAARRRRAWEARLAPLAELVAPVPPPEGLLGRVMERIGEDEAAGTARALARERGRVARWRGATVAFAAAAALAAVVAFVGTPAGGPDLVSVATAADGTAALVISLEDGRATVRPVAVDAPPSGSLELWHIAQGGAPVSLGLVDPTATFQLALAAQPGDVAAVSHEPVGGSPTGQPTGPVLFSGPFLSLR